MMVGGGHLSLSFLHFLFCYCFVTFSCFIWLIFFFSRWHSKATVDGSKVTRTPFHPRTSFLVIDLYILHSVFCLSVCRWKTSRWHGNSSPKCITFTHTHIPSYISASVFFNVSWPSFYLNLSLKSLRLHCQRVCVCACQSFSQRLCKLWLCRSPIGSKTLFLTMRTTARNNLLSNVCIRVLLYIYWITNLSFFWQSKNRNKEEYVGLK